MTQIDVLDHGFIRLIDTMGDDSAIVQAARVSYGDGTKTPSDDRSLIRYLMRHWHSTPFEMCEIKIHVRLPLFVARQWIRHRTANVNEYSARYSIVPDLYYVPEPDRLGRQSSENKQGTGEPLPAELTNYALNLIEITSSDSFDAYKDLSCERGGNTLSRELARIILPQNAYTEWYWKIDLHNLLRFMLLRSDSHAQWEIRQYANAIGRIVADWVPNAYEAWVDYQRDAVTFSRLEMIALRQLLDWGKLDQPEGMSDRELKEFALKINR